MIKAPILLGLGLVATIGMAGCSSKAGNVAVGAGAAGAAYEYSNKRQLDKLDEDLKAGRISKDEHDRRAKEIKDRSVVN